MSFQYDTFQTPQGQQDGSGPRPGAPQEQDPTMGGQIPDNSAAQFQGGNGGDPNSAGGQQPGGDAKTTLWYDIHSISLTLASVLWACISAAKQDFCLSTAGIGKARSMRDLGLHCH